MISKRWLRWRWLHIYPLVLACMVLGGWFQAPSASDVPAPTIRVSTHLVLVDVVVTDKQGAGITGLRPEDFVVEENGKPQKISTFVPPGEKTAAGQPLPTGFYSNRPQYVSPGGPATVMLLDAVNTPFSDQSYARRQMLSFVQEQYKPGQRMAIFALTGSLKVLQDFTSDPQILYTALQRYKPQPQEFVTAGKASTSAARVDPTTGSNVTAVDASIAPLHIADGSAEGVGGGGAATLIAMAQAAIDSFAGAQTSYAEDQRATITLAALNSLANTLGGLPGRKNLIWVTGHLPFSINPENNTVTDAELAESLPSFDTRRVGEHAAGSQAATFRQAHSQEIRQLNARLSSAQVAIYPVDARGLSISIATDSQETMRDMARETGGRAYVNQNEIKVGVARAFSDSAASYTLGYYPENKKYDGKYRSIKIKVKRDGVETDNRRGYFAIDPAQVKGYNPAQDVAAALQEAIPSTLVYFNARVQPPAANASAKGKVGVDFLVDASSLSTEDAAGGKKVNVAFYVAVYAPGGKMLSDHSMKVDQAFDTSTYQQILQRGLQVHMDVDPVAEGKQLHLAVQDLRTGLVGTVDAPMPQ